MLAQLPDAKEIAASPNREFYLLIVVLFAVASGAWILINRMLNRQEVKDKEHREDREKFLAAIESNTEKVRELSVINAKQNESMGVAEERTTERHDENREDNTKMRHAIKDLAQSMKLRTTLEERDEKEHPRPDRPQG